MTLSTYLYFAGNCKEALAFYEKTLGGKISFAMPFGGSPAEGMMPEGWSDKILHASMELGGQVVMVSDAPPNHYDRMSGFAMSIEAESVEDAQVKFAALADGGQVTMAMAPTFWSPMFGMCKDRFGTPWMVSAPGEA